MHFEGSPCKRCRATLRYVKSRACVSCGRAHAKGQRTGDNYAGFLEYQKARAKRMGPRKETEIEKARNREKYKLISAAKAEEKKAYIEANAVALVALAAEKAALHAKRKRAYMRKWRANNPAQQAAQNRVKKGRKMRAEGRHTASDVAVIGNLQKWRCAWCKVSCRDSYHVDHIMPLSRGGSNWPNNLCISCPTCNMRKKHKLPNEWAKVNGRLL